MGEQFYRRWMSAHVRITKGPFAGKEGQVTAVCEPRVQVAFAPSTLQKDRIWFDVSQVEPA